MCQNEPLAINETSRLFSYLHACLSTPYILQLKRQTANSQSLPILHRPVTDQSRKYHDKLWQLSLIVWTCWLVYSWQQKKSTSLLDFFPRTIRPTSFLTSSPSSSHVHRNVHANLAVAKSFFKAILACNMHVRWCKTLVIISKDAIVFQWLPTLTLSFFMSVRHLSESLHNSIACEASFEKRKRRED